MVLNPVRLPILKKRLLDLLPDRLITGSPLKHPANLDYDFELHLVELCTGHQGKAQQQQQRRGIAYQADVAHLVALQNIHELFRRIQLRRCVLALIELIEIIQRCGGCTRDARLLWRSAGCKNQCKYCYCLSFHEKFLSLTGRTPRVLAIFISRLLCAHYLGYALAFR